MFLYRGSSMTRVIKYVVLLRCPLVLEIILPEKGTLDLPPPIKLESGYMIEDYKSENAGGVIGFLFYLLFNLNKLLTIIIMRHCPTQ
jgi:hypothetical protein